MRHSRKYKEPSYGKISAFALSAMLLKFPDKFNLEDCFNYQLSTYRGVRKSAAILAVKNYAGDFNDEVKRRYENH